MRKRLKQANWGAHQFLALSQVVGVPKAARLYGRIARTGTETILESEAGPVALRGGSSDLMVFKEVAIDRGYDLQFVDKPSFIIDAGANVGMASMWFARRHPQADVVALEPDTGNFEMLKKNTARFPNVTPLAKALWTEETELTLEDPGSGDWGLVATSGHSYGAARSQVQATSVPALLEQFGHDEVDLLKVDIEGGEVELLADCDEWIHKVKYLLVETHERRRPESWTNVMKLREKNFVVGPRFGDNWLFIRYPQPTEIPPPARPAG